MQMRTGHAHRGHKRLARRMSARIRVIRTKIMCFSRPGVRKWTPPQRQSTRRTKKPQKDGPAIADWHWDGRLWTHPAAADIMLLLWIVGLCFTKSEHFWLTAWLGYKKRQFLLNKIVMHKIDMRNRVTERAAEMWLNLNGALGCETSIVVLKPQMLACYV